MIGVILAALAFGMLYAFGRLIQSLERERLEADRLRREIELKERQTAVILEPRTEQDAVDRLDRGSF